MVRKRKADILSILIITVTAALLLSFNHMSGRVGIRPVNSATEKEERCLYGHLAVHLKQRQRQLSYNTDNELIFHFQYGDQAPGHMAPTRMNLWRAEPCT